MATPTLTFAEFMGLLPVSEVEFRLGEAATFSETQGGERIKHNIGARLWTGEVVLDRDWHRDAIRIETLIAELVEADASFMVADPRSTGPAFDPQGVWLGSASPMIDGVSATNARLISLSGLPAGYRLSMGDYLGFDYGANPTRHALHRVTADVIATGAGEMAALPVQPMVRPGAQAGTPVTLLRPTCKAKIDTATYGRGRSLLSSGGKFTWSQTLR